MWKVSKYGVISGPFLPVFGLNTGKYGPEVTPYLHTFHAVRTAYLLIRQLLNGMANFCNYLNNTLENSEQSY